VEVWQTQVLYEALVIMCVYLASLKPLELVSIPRTRTNTNPDDTKAIAVGRSGCACGAQKVRMCWGGVGRRRCRVALVCVLSLKPFWAVWRRQL
jgi:hypothetical protein